MKLNHLFRRGRESSAVRQIRRELQETKALAAQGLVRQLPDDAALPRLADAEFQVYSQFGDDGIIQYLVKLLKIEPQTFVEFGVEDYLESNTRFLLTNNNWRGLVMDGSARNIESIRRDPIFWRHDVTAVCAFVDRENINRLIAESGFAGELGLLSIDIDGNDFWVWERIDCVRPAMVVAEYNSVFGAEHAVSIPYDPGFMRSSAHFSHLYWGCSLKALCVLAERKGYSFVGSNSAGNNAYFVRADRMGPLRPVSAEDGYVESRFRESRDVEGKLSYLAGNNRLAAIADMPVVDVETGRKLQLREIAATAKPVAAQPALTGAAA